jgi:hypothetical protein
MHFISPAITGLPVTLSLQIKYTTSSSFGAVLVTEPPVTHNAFYYTSPFTTWVQDNAHALLSGDYKEDIRKNGLVVVTQTYTTSKCSITAWTDTKSEAFLGFDVGIKGAGDVKAQGGWYEGNSAGGWEKYEEDGENKLVVFVGGLWYSCEKGAFESFGTEKVEMGRQQEPIGVMNASGEKFQLHGQRWGAPLAKDPLHKE